VLVVVVEEDEWEGHSWTVVGLQALAYPQRRRPNAELPVEDPHRQEEEGEEPFGVPATVA